MFSHYLWIKFGLLCPFKNKISLYEGYSGERRWLSLLISSASKHIYLWEHRRPLIFLAWNVLPTLWHLWVLLSRLSKFKVFCNSYSKVLYALWWPFETLFFLLTDSLPQKFYICLTLNRQNLILSAMIFGLEFGNFLTW